VNCTIGELASISDVNVLSIIEDLSMVAAYHRHDGRRFNEAAAK
jgi:hypothetical protein